MKSSFCKGVIGLSAILLAVSAQAEKWSPDWGVGAEVTFDDNFLMRENEQDTWVYQVTPSLGVNYESPVAFSSFKALYDVKRYSEFDEFDSEDPHVTWDTSYQQQRVTWLFSAGYHEYSQRDLAEEDTGEFDTTTVVETISVRPGVIVQVGERDELQLSLGYSERDYDASDFADNDNESVALSWRHAFSRVLAGEISGSFSNYFAEIAGLEETDTDYLTASLGIIYNVSEVLTFNASAGYFEIDQELTLLVPATVIETDDSGGVVEMGFNYETENNKWSLTLSRSLYPSSQGEIDERDSVSASWVRQLSKRTSAGLSGLWSDTSSDDLNADGREVTRLQPFYAYKLTPKLEMKASYTFLSFDRPTGVQVESNRFNLGLQYQF